MRTAQEIRAALVEIEGEPHDARHARLFKVECAARALREDAKPYTTAHADALAIELEAYRFKLFGR